MPVIRICGRWIQLNRFVSGFSLFSSFSQRCHWKTFWWNCSSEERRASGKPQNLPKSTGLPEVTLHDVLGHRCVNYRCSGLTHLQHWVKAEMDLMSLKFKMKCLKKQSESLVQVQCLRCISHVASVSSMVDMVTTWADPEQTSTKELASSSLVS